MEPQAGLGAGTVISIKQETWPDTRHLTATNWSRDLMAISTWNSQCQNAVTWHHAKQECKSKWLKPHHCRSSRTRRSFHTSDHFNLKLWDSDLGTMKKVSRNRTNRDQNISNWEKSFVSCQCVGEVRTEHRPCVLSLTKQALYLTLLKWMKLTATEGTFRASIIFVTCLRGNQWFWYDSMIQWQYCRLE